MDPEAEVLAEYRGWLRTVASGLIADTHLQQDLAAEGWVAMWRALRTYNPDRGPLPAWLTYKAIARMRDCARDRCWLGQPARRHGRTPILSAVEYPSSTDAPWELLAGPDALDGVLWAYHRGAILDAINRLSPAQRRYVWLRFWHGMGDRQLAAAFGYDPHGLWTSPVNGARGKLRASLQHLAS